MILINNIFKERITDKLSHKERYLVQKKYLRTNKIIYSVDNNNYCLYINKRYKYDGVYEINRKKYEYDLFWYKNGLLHRDLDQPSLIIYDGTKEYHKNGKLHRNHQNGKPQPAFINSTGFGRYFINGIEFFPK